MARTSGCSRGNREAGASRYMVIGKKLTETVRGALRKYAYSRARRSTQKNRGLVVLAGRQHSAADRGERIIPACESPIEVDGRITVARPGYM